MSPLPLQRHKKYPAVAIVAGGLRIPAGCRAIPAVALLIVSLFAPPANMTYSPAAFMPHRNGGNYLKPTYSYSTGESFLLASQRSAASLAELQVASSPSAPSAPRNLTAQVTGPHQVSLSWFPPASNGGAPIIGYEVDRDRNGPDIYEKIANFINNQTYYIDNFVATPGITYFYTVSAANSCCSSPYSDEVSIRTPTPPSQPLHLQAIVYTDRINLTWSAPASNGETPVTGYNVYKSDQPSFLQARLISSPGNVTFYTDSSVSPGKTYYYMLTALNGVGEGYWSEVSATTSIQTPTLPSLFMVLVFILATPILLQTRRRQKQ